MSLFTACSDDDDDKVVCPVPQTEFTVATGLNLTYNGGSMLGKKVTFTPDASDATKATLVLAGNLDLSGILTREAASGSFGAGVFPGSPVVTLPVTLNIQVMNVRFPAQVRPIIVLLTMQERLLLLP